MRLTRMQQMRRIFLLGVVAAELTAAGQNVSPTPVSTVGRRAQAPAPGTQFRDCSNGCPEMVMLPPGRFVMGAPSGEEERENVLDSFRGRSVPQHLVTIRHRFAIAKFDVTRDEYAQFVAETNRPDPDSCYTPDVSGGESDKKGANWHSPGFPQTGRDPVVCVSWDDAQAYVAWLSAKTGRVYRLPTEAQWEYAARAGTTTARYGSDRPAELCRYINHADLDFSERHPRDSDVNRECRDGFAFTSPVGSFPPNQFGLYDMLGNVWQWNEDCWNDNYNGASSDDSSRQSGDCGRHVVRGGAYSNIPGLVLSAVRGRYKSWGRDHSGGFRVARTLLPKEQPLRDSPPPLKITSTSGTNLTFSIENRPVLLETGLPHPGWTNDKIHANRVVNHSPKQSLLSHYSPKFNVVFSRKDCICCM